MKHLLQAFILLALAAGASCNRAAPAGPPELRLGRDECRECGMAIHEERCAAAIVIDRDGRRDSMLFDDIGCMLDIEREGKVKVLGRYVHDHSSGAWTDAAAASFIATDGSQLRTPMGSGIAAFADRQGARKAQEHYGGEILDYDALGDWRRKQREDRLKGK